jgi:predicted acylesterase/phospholipase RssA
MNNEIENDEYENENPEENKKTDTDNPEEKVIKHIVLTGGGSVGYLEYGILKDSHKSGFWSFDNIETIYGTSAGAIFGLVVSLKIDWDVLDDYIIKRPWQNVFKIDMYSAVNSFNTMGMLNKKVIEDVFEPLFKAKDLTLDVTMIELYEFTKIELHLFCTELDNLELIDMSYKTHPDWKVVDVAYASCCLPFLFQPFVKDNKTYFDGGICSNYPIRHCYSSCKCPDEIFGIGKNLEIEYPLTSESTLFDYMFKILKKLILKVSIHERPIIKNEIILDCPDTTIYDIYLATSSMEERTKLIDKGVNIWRERMKTFVNIVEY